MASPFFSGRIPQELYDHVEQHIQESGESKTQVLIDALSQYLGIETSKSKASSVNKDLLLSELESLKERVSLLEKSQPKRLSLLSLDNNNDNNLITDDNRVMVLATTKVVELTGIARSTFEDRHKDGKLPISKNGYTILAHAGKQTEKPFANLWKVTIGNI
jgi:hypothetical protein